jgi:hypothetical protein
MSTKQNGPHKDEPQKQHTQDFTIPPAMPRPRTRQAQVLAALLRGERPTHAIAVHRGWGWRLAADVFALRKKGWQIVTEEIQQAKGNPIARYWLPANKRGAAE